jgi:hypothetical protein
MPSAWHTVLQPARIRHGDLAATCALMAVNIWVASASARIDDIVEDGCSGLLSARVSFTHTDHLAADADRIIYCESSESLIKSRAGYLYENLQRVAHNGSSPMTHSSPHAEYRRE